MSLLILHFLAIVGLTCYLFRQIKALSVELKIYAGFILTWSSIVFSSALLASFNQLGNNLLFSIVMAGLQVLGASLIAKGYHGIPKESQLSPTAWLKATFSSKPRAALATAFVGILFVLFIMCLFGIMQIPDTLSMKLPNAFFYLQEGNLLPHRDMSDNGRLFSTPINGTLWWTYFLVRWQSSRKLILFLNLLNWLLTTTAIYRFSRTLQISRWGSVISAMFFAFSLGGIFQAASDNDDLLSSVSAILGAVFILRWLRSRLPVELMIAAAGIGLSVGSKYFPVLYAPAFLLLGSYVGYLIATKRMSFHDIRIRQLLWAGILSAALVVPYLAARYIDEKNIGPAPVLAMSENRPFRFDIATHNLIIYNLQLFVSPLVDAIAPLNGPHREKITSQFNDFVVKNFVPVVDGVFAYMPGVIIVHNQLYDNTSWFGLSSLLFLFFIFWFLLKKEYRFSVWFWLAIFFLSWDLFFCVRTKYIEELGRYWHLPIALALPLIGKGYDHFIEFGQVARGRSIFRITLYTILCITIFSGYYGLLHNPIRYNFFQSWNREIQPHDVSDKMKEILKSCDDVNVRNVIYGYPVYSVMHYFKGERLFHNVDSKEGQLDIVPGINVPLDFRFYQFKYIPIELPESAGTGFKNSGDSGYGFPLFVRQDQSERCPSSKNLDGPEYALAQVQVVADGKDKSLSVEIRIDGADSLVAPKFRVILSGPEIPVVELQPWTTNNKFIVQVAPQNARLEIQISSNEKMFSGNMQILSKVP